MFERGLSSDDVASVVSKGETIQEYPDDKPYPFRLVLGWSGTRPIHVVYADNAKDGETVIITVYEPDLRHFEPDFRTRRTP